MKQTVLWTLARRQVWSRINSKVVRLVSGLSVAGVGIGVAALIIIQAFMGGFTKAVTTGISAVNPPLFIYVPGDGLMSDEDLHFVRSLADEVDGITDVEGVLERPAVVSGNGGTVSGAVVRGKRTSVLVMGSDLARELEVVPGDEIRLASTAGAAVSGMGRVLVDTIAVLTVDSVSDFGLQEYNSSLLEIPLEEARKIFGADDELTNMVAFVEEGKDPVTLADQLNSALYGEYTGGGWPVYMSCVPFLSFHGNLFKALGLEQMAMTIVLALITVVALLNLSSALTMISLEHARDIGVLRAMGLLPADVFQISLLRGLLLGGVGAAAGFGFSWIVVFVVNRYFPLRLDGTVYWIDVLPGVFPLKTAFLISFFTVIVCLMVAVFPAFSALSKSPSEALRYE